MKKEDLRKAMSDISDEFILEAAPDCGSSEVIPVYRRPWFRLASSLAAACIVIVLGLGVYRNSFLPKQNAPSENSTVQEKAEPPVTAAEEGEAAQMEMEMDAGQAEQVQIPLAQPLREENGAGPVNHQINQDISGGTPFLLEDQLEMEVRPEPV